MDGQVLAGSLVMYLIWQSLVAWYMSKIHELLSIAGGTMSDTIREA